MPQAKLPLAAILFEEVLTLERAIEIVRYRQQRNYAAYRSHRLHRDQAQKTSKAA